MQSSSHTLPIQSSRLTRPVQSRIYLVDRAYLHKVVVILYLYKVVGRPVQSRRQNLPEDRPYLHKVVVRLYLYRVAIQSSRQTCAKQ